LRAGGQHDRCRSISHLLFHSDGDLAARRAMRAARAAKRDSAAAPPRASFGADGRSSTASLVGGAGGGTLDERLGGLAVEGIAEGDEEGTQPPLR